MIRMYVGVDHVRNPHALACREGRIGLHIVWARIDDGALAERAAAKQVRRTSEVVVVEGTEDHDVITSFERTLTLRHSADAARWQSPRPN